MLDISKIGYTACILYVSPTAYCNTLNIDFSCTVHLEHKNGTWICCVGRYEKEDSSWYEYSYCPSEDAGYGRTVHAWPHG